MFCFWPFSALSHPAAATSRIVLTCHLRHTAPLCQNLWTLHWLPDKIQNHEQGHCTLARINILTLIPKTTVLTFLNLPGSSHTVNVTIALDYLCEYPQAISLVWTVGPVSIYSVEEIIPKLKQEAWSARHRTIIPLFNKYLANLHFAEHQGWHKLICPCSWGESQLLQIIFRFFRALEWPYPEPPWSNWALGLSLYLCFLATLGFNLLTLQGKLGHCLSLSVVLELVNWPGLSGLAPCLSLSSCRTPPILDPTLCYLVSSVLPWPKPLQSGLPRTKWAT